MVLPPVPRKGPRSTWMMLRASGNKVRTSCRKTRQRKPCLHRLGKELVVPAQGVDAERSPSLKCGRVEGILAAKARSPMLVWPTERLPNMMAFFSTGANPALRQILEFN